MDAIKVRWKHCLPFHTMIPTRGSWPWNCWKMKDSEILEELLLSLTSSKEGRMRICHFSWKVTMAKANKSPEAKKLVPVNAQNSSSGGRGSFTWLHSRVFHGEGHLLGSNKSPFQTLAEALYIGRKLELIKSSWPSADQFKLKAREENKSKLSPFFCQEEVLFDFYLHPECSLEKNKPFGNVQRSVDNPPTSFSVSIASLGTRALISFPVNDEAQMLWINHSLWGENKQILIINNASRSCCGSL